MKKMSKMSKGLIASGMNRVMWRGAWLWVQLKRRTRVVAAVIGLGTLAAGGCTVGVQDGNGNRYECRVERHGVECAYPSPTTTPSTEPGSITTQQVAP